MGVDVVEVIEAKECIYSWIIRRSDLDAIAAI